MPQDQQFKETLQAFFPDFIALFYPDVAAGFDWARGVTFLDKETFTDVGTGRRREADIVAQAFTRSGTPEIILLHVEVQTQRRAVFARRMWEYYALLWLRRGLPVLPIALYLAPGTGGLVTETFETALFGQPILTFRYRAVGLPDLAEADYAEQNNPLAPALGTFMRSPETRRVLRRLRALQKLAIMQTDDARRALLLGLIDRALPLAGEQEVNGGLRLRCFATSPLRTPTLRAGHEPRP